MKYRIAAFMPGNQTLLVYDEAGKLHWFNPFTGAMGPEQEDWMVASACSKYGCLHAEDDEAQPKTAEELQEFVKSFWK